MNGVAEGLLLRRRPGKQSGVRSADDYAPQRPGIHHAYSVYVSEILGLLLFLPYKTQFRPTSSCVLLVVAFATLCLVGHYLLRPVRYNARRKSSHGSFKEINLLLT